MATMRSMAKLRYYVIHLLFIALSFRHSDATGLTNVALGRHAYHRPGDWDNAYKAVDGNENTNNPYGDVCTHTNSELDNPWWKVDLGKNFYVSRVSLLNRGECCAYRLSNFEVRVGGLTSEGELCHRQETAVGAGVWLDMDCPQPLLGRIVTVEIFAPAPKDGQEVLTICEAKVMADATVTAMAGSVAAVDRSVPESPAGRTSVRSRSECASLCLSGQTACGMMTVCREGAAMWCLLGDTADVNLLQVKTGCTTYSTG